jgi:hypothetical protein
MPVVPPALDSVDDPTESMLTRPLDGPGLDAVAPWPREGASVRPHDRDHDHEPDAQRPTPYLAIALSAYAFSHQRLGDSESGGVLTRSACVGVVEPVTSGLADCCGIGMPCQPIDIMLDATSNGTGAHHEPILIPRP